MREQSGLSPFRAEVLAQGRNPSVDYTSIGLVPAPDFVRERLNLDDRSHVIRHENWYFADAEPVQIGYTYISPNVAGDTVLSDSPELGPGSIYARFEDQGYPIYYTREEITARMPTPSEAVGLKIPDGVPVINLIHTGLTKKHVPFEVTHFVIRADLNGLDYLMTVDP